MSLQARLKPVYERMPGATFQQVVQAAFFDRIDLSAHVSSTAASVSPYLFFDRIDLSAHVSAQTQR